LQITARTQIVARLMADELAFHAAAMPKMLPHEGGGEGQN
jgi:hypothetical protein